MTAKSLYRFRTIDALLGSREELERQELYFASPHELNDPMEGFKDLFWSGDQIVWENLIRHYIRYLIYVTSIVVLMGEDFEEQDYGDLVFHTNATFPSEKIRLLYNDTCISAFEGSFISDFLKPFTSDRRQVRRDELLFILRTLHGQILSSVFSNFKKYKIGKFADNIPQDLATRLLATLTKGLTSLQGGFNSSIFDALKKGSDTLYEEMSYHRALSQNDKKASGVSYLAFQIPDRYLADVGRLIYFDWYAVCFCEKRDNPSIWAHYADGHRGVCLVFDTNKGSDETFYLGLNSSGRKMDFPFYKIEYTEKFETIDFFRSLGRHPRATLTSDWYSDDFGASSCCADIFENEEVWRTKLWRQFYSNITCKLRDWDYEAESRLVISDTLDMYQKKENRLFKYDFSSLQGLIFGINTRLDDKLRIIEILRKKCAQHNRLDFDFFQAYYSSSTGRIDLRKLDLLISPFALKVEQWSKRLMP